MSVTDVESSGRSWSLAACRCEIETPAAREHAANVRWTPDLERVDPELAAAIAEGDARDPSRVPPPDAQPPWAHDVEEDPHTVVELDKHSRNGDGTPGLLSGLRNGAWLDAQDFPPLRYHLPGIIPEGFTLLVGPPKIGKSWFVLALALAAALGGRALGLPVDRRPVLYLALEDGDRRMKDRCRILLRGDAIPRAFEYLTAIQPMTVLATIEAWLDRYPSDEPLIILDTLGKTMPPALMGESSYGRDYRVGSALKALSDSRPRSALVVNHHDRKAASEDFVEKVSGSNGLAGSADTVVVLARKRNEPDGLLAVTGRDVAEGEYAVRFDGSAGLWSLDGRDLASAASRVAQRRASDGLDERARAVVQYVNEHPDGVRFADVKRDLGDAEARYLSRLAEGDRIARPSRGLYAPLSEVSEVSVPDNETDTTDTTDSPPGDPLGPVPEMF